MSCSGADCSWNSEEDCNGDGEGHDGSGIRGGGGSTDNCADGIWCRRNGGVGAMVTVNLMVAAIVVGGEMKLWFHSARADSLRRWL